MSVPHTNSNVCVIFVMTWEGQVGERRYTLSNEVGGAREGDKVVNRVLLLAVELGEAHAFD